MTSPATSVLDHRVLDRVRGEYLEMPGLTLTHAQVQRLCGIDQATCTAVLDSLEKALFLRRRSDGTYVRLTEGSIPSPRAAKAALHATTSVPERRRAS
jgi:hypothetical protein